MTLLHQGRHRHFAQHSALRFDHPGAGHAADGGLRSDQSADHHTLAVLPREVRQSYVRAEKFHFVGNIVRVDVQDWDWLDQFDSHSNAPLCVVAPRASAASQVCHRTATKVKGDSRHLLISFDGTRRSPLTKPAKTSIRNVSATHCPVDDLSAELALIISDNRVSLEHLSNDTGSDCGLTWSMKTKTYSPSPIAVTSDELNSMAPRRVMQ